MERVKVYRSMEPTRIWIHTITTPVFTENKEGIYPRLEVRNGHISGWTGNLNSRYVWGEYPWIPKDQVIECYYDKDEGKLL